MWRAETERPRKMPIQQVELAGSWLSGELRRPCTGRCWISELTAKSSWEYRVGWAQGGVTLRSSAWLLSVLESHSLVGARRVALGCKATWEVVSGSWWLWAVEEPCQHCRSLQLKELGTGKVMLKKGLVLEKLLQESSDWSNHLRDPFLLQCFSSAL